MRHQSVHPVRTSTLQHKTIRSGRQDITESPTLSAVVWQSDSHKKITPESQRGYGITQNAGYCMIVCFTGDLAVYLSSEYKQNNSELSCSNDPVTDSLYNTNRFNQLFRSHGNFLFFLFFYDIHIFWREVNRRLQTSPNDDYSYHQSRPQIVYSPIHFLI